MTDTWLRDQAAQRRAAGLHRTLRARDESRVDLASNDYLSLSQDPRVIAGAIAAVTEWGTGSTASRLVTGTTDLHLQFERALASFVGTQSSLVFSSGYLANLGAVTSLSDPHTLVLSDAANHASLIDACRLSRAEVKVYPSGDLAAVQKYLADRTQRRALVVTDAVVSVDGNLSPLPELHAICRSQGAWLLVDEAHSLGVLGPGGRGALSAASLAGEPDVVITATLSKSLASQGGAVLGSSEVIEHLVDSARTMIFDTGLTPAAVGASLAALTVLIDEPDLPARAAGSALLLHSALLAAGWRSRRPEAAVASALIGDPMAAVAAQRDCQELGLAVGCFRPPSVPDGVSRLRLTGHAGLSPDELRMAETVLTTVAQRGRP